MVPTPPSLSVSVVRANTHLAPTAVTFLENSVRYICRNAPAQTRVQPNRQFEWVEGKALMLACVVSGLLMLGIVPKISGPGMVFALSVSGLRMVFKLQH